MDALTLRIEEAALNAVVPLEQAIFDGWALRFARGFTKRRNSVNPLYAGTLPLDAKIAYVESLFAARKLPPVFRLTPGHEPLDAALSARGYAPHADRVAVMVADLTPQNTAGARNVTIARQGVDEWLPLHDSIGHIPTEQQALHRDLLSRIPADCYYATTFDSIRPAACVLGVREADLVGIFELVTAPDLRRKGHGANIVTTVLGWAAADGARRAYLQVMESNAAAISLYQKLGFRTAYTYWYRARL